MAPTSQPTLPKKGAKGAAAKKGAASATQLPIAHASFITLEDGTQVPVRIPPGMPKEQAEGIIAYLKANPEAAKAAWQQAQAIMQNPGLSNAFINMQNQSDPTKSAEIYAALKDDPELQHVFEDVKENGPGALQKYWDDSDLMGKISAKLRDMKVSEAEATAANNKAGKKAGKPASDDIKTLHDAAKWGDAAAAQRLLDGGADVNGLNERGITALGVAVGFNQKDLVELLLAAGADLELRDQSDNTVLHYAAGYGRLELAKLLLAKGADLDSINCKKQKPVDVARLNGEKHVVAYLEKLAAGEQPEESS